MVLRYTTGDFNEQYMPTIGDMYTKDVEVFGAPRHIEIDDTAGQEAYADLKREKLGTGDGYFLVYSITDDTTFGKLDRVREEILKAHGQPVPAAGAKATDPATTPKIPMVLVGTKADLSSDRAVSEKERNAKARAWGCKSFEVSAKTNTGVAELFDALISDIVGGAGNDKGASGGSVLGAGMRVQGMGLPELAPSKKRACEIV
jgi:small GTP-binding protein